MMRRKDWGEVLFTCLTAGTGVALIVASMEEGQPAGARIFLALGGLGGIVAAARHPLAALIRRMR